MTKLFPCLKLTFIWLCFVTVSLQPCETYSATKNDVLTGMDIESALLITKNCVHEAAGIKISKIRPNDTLDFLGISDELRLDALRRYIVRNTEIGVQSVWSYHKIQRLAKHYIISNAVINQVEASWTVEKLAAFISKNAGLPQLPLEKAAQIIADSRKLAIQRSDEIDTSTVILSDITDNNLPEFVRILFSEKGIKSAGVTDPTGDVYNYQMIDGISEAMLVNEIRTCSWKYSDLIQFLSDYSEVPLSPELTAALLVVNAILTSANQNLLQVLRNPRQLNPNAPIITLNLNSFRLSDLFGNNNISEEIKLSDLNLDIDNFKAALVGLINPLIDFETPCNGLRQNNVRRSNLSVTKTKRNRISQLIAVISVADLKDIKPNSTVGKAVDIVTEILSK